MSPWWLRPTAEGASDEEERDDRADRPAAGDSEPSPYSPAPAPPPAEQASPFVPVEEAGARYETSPPPSAAAGAALPVEAEEDVEIEAEAEAEEDEEKEEGEEKEGDEKDEGRVRRRPRSRRGGRGRRKNGRAAAAPAEEHEEEEEPREEPAAVAPMPARRERPERPERPERAAFEIFPAELEAPREREYVYTLPERGRSIQDERKIALFCDLENVALGVRDSDIGKFDILLVLERLLEKGKIIVKKAYADWERYSDYKRQFHEAAIELIDIPQKYYSGKNSADIKMVVDAMDLCYAKEHLDTFVLLSGDSDFSPLVSKLKENNKYVIGIGVKNSSSNLLVDNCDEFIYYEDVWRDAQRGPKLDGLNKKTAEAFSLMVESMQALVRENKDVLWGSMIKQTMQRKKPSFNEGYYGYSTFSELLEDAERKNIIKLKKDQRSGTYIVTGFAKR